MSTNNDEKFKFSPLEIVGGYTLVRPLGKGYRSEVWLGQKENKQEEEEENKPENVAIKIFTGSILDQEGTKDFLKEGATLQKFDHYNIVKVIYFGIDKDHGNIPYIVMHKEGSDLRKLYPRGTVVPLKKVVSYVNKIASALHYAHMRGVFHRDIKPANILYIDSQKAQEEDSVRVSDFGIAALPKNNPQNDGIVGYYAYMAPEQEENPSPASDQYALAVMVYEWLCGALPFTGTSKELTQQHKSTPPPSLCQRDPGISPAVEAVVMRGLSKEPDERYGNVLQFAQALEVAAFPSASSSSKSNEGQTRTRRWVLSAMLALLIATALSLIARAVESVFSPVGPQPHPNVATFEQQSEVETIAWSPDSKRIASSGIDGNIRIWNIATQRQTIRPYKQGSRVLAMMWLSDNKRIASLSVDGMLHIWDSISGKQYLQFRRTDISNEVSLGRKQVATWAATGDLATSLGMTVLVYDSSTSSGFTIPDITFPIHSSPVKALGFSPAGDMIASCDSDGIIWVWSPDNARPLHPPYQGHTSEVLSVGWQPQPKSQSQFGLIASGDLDGVVQIWHWHATPEANAGELHASYWHDGSVHAVAWSPDGQYLVSGGADRVALVWKWRKSGQSPSKYTGHANTINVVAVSPNGKLVASGSLDETVQVWKL